MRWMLELDDDAWSRWVCCCCQLLQSRADAIRCKNVQISLCVASGASVFLQFFAVFSLRAIASALCVSRRSVSQWRHRTLAEVTNHPVAKPERDRSVSTSSRLWCKRDVQEPYNLRPSLTPAQRHYVSTNLSGKIISHLTLAQAAPAYTHSVIQRRSLLLINLHETRQYL